MKAMMKNMKTYSDIASAIKVANGLGHHCVGRRIDQDSAASTEWIVYPSFAGAPQGVRPDMLCIGNGNIPIPMTREGTEALRSLVKTDPACWETDLIAGAEHFKERLPVVRGCSR